MQSKTHCQATFGLVQEYFIRNNAFVVVTFPNWKLSGIVFYEAVKDLDSPYYGWLLLLMTTDSVRRGIYSPLALVEYTEIACCRIDRE